MSEKPDPKDFMLSNLQEQEIVRLPGQIKGYDFVIENLTKCNVWLLDHSAQITIDDCENCNFYIGPCEGAIFFRDCTGCTVSASSSQFRMKNCTHFDLFLCTNSDPSIEYCSNLRVAPLNLKYPDQDLHFRSAKLDSSNNFWSQVFDFNMTEGTSNWSLLPPDEFQEKERTVENMNTPINPVDRPVSYGGSITEEIIVGSQQQSGSMGGMQSFGLGTTQAEAEAMVSQSYEQMDEDSDPFGAPADPFGAPADPFAAPSNDPFAAPSSDPFSAPAASDPFAASRDDPFSQPSAEEAEVDAEEMERNRLRDAEYQARMQALYEREEAERVEKDSRRNTATSQLSEWLQNRNKAIETRKKANADEEEVFREQKSKRNEKSWQTVVEMIDFKEQTDSKDRTRLRSVLLAKKSEG